MGFFQKHKERVEKLKQTDAYKRSQYLQKRKIKLLLYVVPIVFIPVYLLMKYTEIDQNILKYGGLIIAVLALNFCAEYLTQKNYDSKNASNDRP